MYEYCISLCVDGQFITETCRGFKVMYYMKFCCVFMLVYVNDCDYRLFLALQQFLANCILRDDREAEAVVT